MPETGRTKLIWICNMCDTPSDRKHNMIRHLSSVHKIINNFEDNMTIKDKNNFINSIKECSIDQINSESNSNYNINPNKHTVMPKLIDMTDKNVQINAQIADLYTYVDKMNDFEYEINNHNDMIDTIVCDSLNHDQKIAKLENIIKILQDDNKQLNNKINTLYDIIAKNNIEISEIVRYTN